MMTRQRRLATTASDFRLGQIENCAKALGERACRDWPVGPLTTYRVGGAAGVFFEVNDEADLGRVSDAVAETGIEVLTLGRGSNLLVADGGFPGLVLTLGANWSQVAISDTLVKAGAAASLPQVARLTAQAGLSGFEWAVGVPGSIGGAIRMNAGGHGSDMSATTVGVTMWDLAEAGVVKVGAGWLGFSYRHSSVTPSYVVLDAELSLVAGERGTSEAEIDEIVAWRRRHQPGGRNAGSVFTNPPGDSAGRLIEVAGLKGYRMGSASVSEKHANFIQADAGGSADDVKALVDFLADEVEARIGIRLVPELKMVGLPGPTAPPPVLDSIWDDPSRSPQDLNDRHGGDR
ncbi:MAG: UDP-N-acetylmuramate dehydrogenase [Acidimicrobiales bacterium]